MPSTSAPLLGLLAWLMTASCLAEAHPFGSSFYVNVHTTEAASLRLTALQVPPGLEAQRMFEPFVLLDVRDGDGNEVGSIELEYPFTRFSIDIRTGDVFSDGTATVYVDGAAIGEVRVGSFGRVELDLTAALEPMAESIYLINGVKLQGSIDVFDQQTGATRAIEPAPPPRDGLPNIPP